MQDNPSGSYPMLPPPWDEYEIRYLSCVPTPLGFSYYESLFLRGASDEIRRIAPLATFEFAVLVGVEVLLYAAEGVAPNFLVGSFRFDDVRGGMLFQLQTHLMDIPSHFGLYKVAGRIRMEPVLVALAVHRVTETDWSSSGGSDDFISYDFTTVTVKAYWAEKTDLLRLQRVDDGHVVPLKKPAIDMHRLPVLTRRMTFKDGRDYQRYHAIFGDDAGPPPNVTPDIVGDFDNVNVLKAVGEKMVGHFS